MVERRSLIVLLSVDGFYSAHFAPEHTHTHTRVHIHIIQCICFASSMHGNWIGFYGLCKTHIIQFNLTYCFKRLMPHEFKHAVRYCKLCACFSLPHTNSHYFVLFLDFCLSSSRCRSFLFTFLSLSRIVHSVVTLQQRKASHSHPQNNRHNKTA